MSLAISLDFQRLKIILYSCAKSQIFSLHLSYLQCYASICFMGRDHCQNSYIHDLIAFSSMFYQHSDSWFRTYSANGASLLDYTIMHLYIIYYTIYIQTYVSMYIHAEEKNKNPSFKISWQSSVFICAMIHIKHSLRVSLLLTLYSCCY